MAWRSCSWNGQNLVLQFKDDNINCSVILNEQYRIVKQEKYIFTNDWFEAQRPFHTSFLKDIDYRSNPFHILEIGSHEGRSSVFFSNYLVNGGSTLTCIDPYKISDDTSPVLSNTMEIFLKNIRMTNESSKIIHIREYSSTATMKLFLAGKLFDYILIDGSHLREDVLMDSVIAFKLLKIGGILFWDDYSQNINGGPGYPKDTIDSFIKCLSHKTEILHVGYHYVIKKLL